MRRILSLLYLLPIASLTIFVFAAYVDVEDTISLHWTAGAFDRLLFWLAYGGMAALFLGLACRFFAARQVVSITLAACLGFTFYALATYPANYDDAHAGPALSRSHEELYMLLAANALLLLIAMLEPRIRSFIAQT